MQKALGSVLVLAVLIGGAGAAPAAPFMALTHGTTYGSGTTSGHVTEGYEFTPTQDITVLQLGVLDLDLDGLIDAHQVGVWTNAGDLLASATVPAGTSATLIDAYRFVSIAPLELMQGVTYVLGAEQREIPGNAYNDPTLWVANASNPVFDPRIGYEGNARATSLWAGFAFPSDSSSLTSAGPNFLAAPEPSTALLLSFGLMGLGVGGRRRAL